MDARYGGIGILGLLTLLVMAGGVISLIVLLWVKGGRAGKIILGCLAVLAALVFFWGSLRVVEQVEPAHMQTSTAPIEYGAVTPQMFKLPFYILIGLAVGVTSLIVWLWRKGGRGGKIALAVLLLVPLPILAIMLFAPLTARNVNREDVVRPKKLPVPEIAAECEPDASSTTQIENIPLPANTYPSMELAAEALARRALELLPDLVPNNETPEIIQIWGNNRGQHNPTFLSNDTLTAAGAVFWDEGHVEKVNIETVTSNVPGEGISGLYPNGVTVILQLEELSTTNAKLPWDESPKMYIASDTLSMRLWGRKGSVTLTQKFIHKPWAADFAAFVSKYHNRRWVRVANPQLATSEQEAQAQAYEQVNAILQCEVQNPALVDKLDAQPRRLLGIVDRYAQRFSRPYGDVYREMLLLDASPDKLGPLLTQIANETAQSWRQQRRSWIGHLVSLAGLFVLICVVYVFLNAATRGYYVWSLRIAAIVLALVGAVLIYMHLRSTGTLP